ncbi:MAG: hypothetical protein WC795_00965 [Candidatus Paceibacterota bacterium]|jgi:hypothetical protein
MIENNQNKNKYLLIAGVVIIIGLIAMWGFKKDYRDGKDDAPYDQASTQIEDENIALEGANDLSPDVVPSAKESYINALKKYATKRIQFGTDSATNRSCFATPNNVTYKNGTKIMLDNRTAISDVIKIGGDTYTVPAYGFRIVTLYSSSMPKTYMVDCNQYQNVLTILLQA